MLSVKSKDAQIVYSKGIEWHPQEINGQLVPFDEHSIAAACFFEYDKMRQRGAQLGSRLDQLKELVSVYWPEPLFYHTVYSDMIFETILLSRKIVCLLGATSAGKTACVAVWILLHHDYYRGDYAASLFSLSEKKLQDTIWKDLVKFYYKSKRPIYGNVMKGLTINSSPDNSTIGIQCLAIKPDTDLLAEATRNAGLHGARIHDVVLEEANAVRESIYASAINIMGGSVGSRMICNANIVQKSGTAFSRVHMPLGGYDNFDIMEPNLSHLGSKYSTRWPIEGGGGYALRIDARDSPGLVNPEKFSFFLTQETIDQYHMTKHITGLVTKYYNFAMGWPLDEDTQSGFSVLTDEEIKGSNLLSPADLETYHWLFSIDMAYEGADKRPLVAAKVGKKLFDGKEVDVFEIAQIYHIESPQKNMMGYYEEIAKKVSKILSAYGRIQPTQLCIDVTAGGNVFAEILSKEMNWPRLPYCISWRQLAPPKYRRLSKISSTDSMEECADRPTEIYRLFQEFVRRKQVYSSSPNVIQPVIRQAKARKFLPEGRAGKVAIEPKENTRARLSGASTDDLDAVCMLFTLARDIHGILPGTPTEKKLGHVFSLENKYEKIKNIIEKFRPRVKRY